MRQDYNNSTLQDRHDEAGAFGNASLQLTDVQPPAPPRRLRIPLWKRLRAFCVALVLLGAVELGAASLTASHFNVKGVRIEGLQNTPNTQVREIAQKLVGQNWLRARSGPVIQSIEKIPTVDTVRVRRVIGWPLQLKVVVQERRPFALIGGGNQWWVVDAKGIPYQTVSQPQTLNLDALTGPDFHPQTGKPLPSAQWQKVTYLLNTMREDQQRDVHGFQWDVRRVYFDRNGNVSLRLKDAPHQELLVQLGTDQWAAKLQRARLALAYLDKTGQRAKVLNFVSYKIPTWIPSSSTKPSDDEEKSHPSA